MVPRRLIYLVTVLAAALLFGAAMPCGVLEAGWTPVCTAQDACEAGDQPHDDPHDCCDACLTCCASVTAPPAAPLPDASVAARTPWWSLEQGPRGLSLSIWRPPRR